MKKILKKVLRRIKWELQRRGFFDNWSDEKFLAFSYHIRMGKKLNLNNPVTFTEKMQWLKIHNRKPEYTQMVDKYAAKKYVEKKLGTQYITKNLGVWDSFDEINLDELPNQFVLKCTHDSGGLVICRDKSSLDWEAEGQKLTKSLKVQYFNQNREWPYKNVKPRIIAEEYMENSEEGLHDYKIWCFNGEPIYIQYITGRIGNMTYEGFYDKDWNLQEFSFHNPIMEKPIAKPERLGELLELARKLSANQPFVRCDFYVLEDGSIRFGEITFFPMSGMESFKPKKMDRKLGDMIDLGYGK